MIVGVVGTGTEVGKTFVTAELIRELVFRGRTVSARKPAQSFDPDDSAPRDADVLAAATGEPPDLVCPPHRHYGIAMAPPMAAAALGRPEFTVRDLAHEVGASINPDAITFVETAGGVRSPIANDGDCLDLLAALDVRKVLLVADAGLGTINLVRLSLDAIATSLPAAASYAYLNRYERTDAVNAANASWIATHLTAPSLDVTSLSRSITG
jgi:dethiobiotin synthetase